MYCSNCGNKLEGNEKFCSSCGTAKEEKKEVVSVATKETKPVEKKSSNVGLIIGIVVGVIIILFACVVAAFKLITPIQSQSQSPSQFSVANTTWTEKDDNSVVDFTKDRISWYKGENDLDNYYSGKYKFYRGEKAIDYITTELNEYGVTREEVNEVIERNSEYKIENFVVFDIRYDTYVLNGKYQEIPRPLVPWFGFMSEDNRSMRVANMNTKTYYNFTLQEKEYE